VILGKADSIRSRPDFPPYAIEHDGQLYVGYSNSGGGVGRVGEGRQLWNNNSGELAVIPVATLRAD
jgi:hypothetical protein